jgi:hypothetical protein
MVKMSHFLEKILEMFRRLFTKAEPSRNDVPYTPNTPIVPPRKEVIAAIVQNKIYNDNAKTSMVTVPQPKVKPISLDKESVLIQRLYDEIYDFALHYDGVFEVKGATIDNDNVTYCIPKSENKLLLSRTKVWSYNNQSYELEYTIRILDNSTGEVTVLAGFLQEQLEQLYELYSHKLVRQKHDEIQLKTIHHIRKFIEE